MLSGIFFRIATTPRFINLLVGVMTEINATTPSFRRPNRATFCDGIIFHAHPSDSYYEKFDGVNATAASSFNL
ncbi:hypothetical protein ACNKHM_10105 [Shigella sonnei]